MPHFTARASFDQLWEDLEQVPEDYLGEIVDGQIVMLPRPEAPHATAASDLGALMITRFRFRIGGPGGWVILHEPRIRFGDDLRIPDLAGWRAARYVRPEKGPFVIIPDWVCEVLSPGPRATIARRSCHSMRSTASGMSG